jgi:hypothetical protein
MEHIFEEDFGNVFETVFVRTHPNMAFSTTMRSFYSQGVEDPFLPAEPTACPISMEPLMTAAITGTKEMATINDTNTSPEDPQSAVRIIRCNHVFSKTI